MHFGRGTTRGGTVRFSLKATLTIFLGIALLLGLRCAQVRSDSLVLVELEREGWRFGREHVGSHFFTSGEFPARSTLWTDFEPNSASKKTGRISNREFQLLARFQTVEILGLGPGVPVDSRILQACSQFKKLHHLSLAAPFDVNECRSELACLAELGELQITQESIPQDDIECINVLLPNTFVLKLNESQFRDLWNYP